MNMKRSALACTLLGGALSLFCVSHLLAGQIDILGSAGSEQFGYQVTVLPNGNFVVTDPYYDAPGPVTDVGRVYLYDGKTLALINTMTGTTANDQVGSGNFGRGVKVLPNGDYVVCSAGWNNSRGAVTRCSGTTGCPAMINSSNSLVGSVAGDAVSSEGIVVLPNGSFVVRSSQWNNGAATTVGALTWFAAAATPTGTVTTSNSRYGTTSGDQIGGIGVVVLSNGNYVTEDAFWDNGGTSDAGAVTFCSGTSACTGAISSANSLVGTTTGDFYGIVITPLTNGNYVVSNGLWDNGGTADVGAATFCNGTTGCHAVVGLANSLLGTVASDLVGLNGAIVLTNGNYVVESTQWNRGAASAAGAATFCSGTSGCVGITVSSANSLVGSTTNDNVGAAVALTNGNYVVNSSNWDNPSGATSTLDYGASTFCSGTSGCVGAVGAGNSLIGHRFGDGVGGYAVALANGNYVVISQRWTDNGFVLAQGCDGTTGCGGQVTSANSLIGSHSNDSVGNVVALTNGNYVVTSGFWDNGNINDAGAATFCSGTSGCIGTVSPANSLVGTKAGDQVGTTGLAIPLVNGNYVVASSSWDTGAAEAGALTFCNGTSGCTGTVTATNSLVGSTASDRLGNDNTGHGVTVLANGDYIVRSVFWHNSGLADAGAVTIGYRNGSTVGPVTASNSVRGGVADGGSAMNFSYDSTNDQLVVGRPAENIVTVFGQAVGGSPISLKITSISCLANGHVVLQGNGVASAVHTVERSLATPATVSFTSLSPTTANGSGAISFQDMTSTGLTKGFYRLTYP
jgi:hypothetical protein